jgi:small subunit ribosomal protein S20|tara:strand:- start:199 stop:459 length:261 start_codon:yes stop_codon:yes gene_type:complete
MANIKSAIKRARQNTKRNELKSSQRAVTRTAIKKVENAIASADKDAAINAFKNVEKTLDSMANKGVLHKNKAARTKSRLNKQVKAL